MRTRVDVTRPESGSWWGATSRAVCDACGWRGPKRDCSRDQERVFLNLDRGHHESHCTAETEEAVTA